MEKRVQGRPSRDAVVGRQRIVEDIREALRVDPALEISRKTLARAIGVTPALITYYFPKSDALLAEVALPVIEAHRIRLSGIVNRSDRPNEKVRDIIGVLHDLYGRDRRLFELYKSFEEKHPEDYAETSAMTAILADFFGSQNNAPNSASFEAIVLQGAVRGMCDLAARIRGERKPYDLVAPEEASRWMERLGLLFAKNGALPSICAATASLA